MSFRHVSALTLMCVASVASAQVVQTDAEVRKVDTASQSIILKHGEIKNLGMSAMTMQFKVADPKMLNSVKAGDKVKFTAAMVDGAVTVTSLEQAK